MSLVEAAETGSAITDRFSGHLPGHRDLRAVLKGAAQVLAIRMTGAVLVYASMILLARWLGAFEFGIYAYVWVWIVILTAALPMGHTSAALRFLPDYLARAKWRRLHGFLKQSFAVVTAASIAVALSGIALVIALRPIIEPYYEVPLIAGLLCLPFSSVQNQMEATARALGWVRLAYIPGYIVRPILLVATVFLLMQTGHMPAGVDALWALVLAFLLICLAQGVQLFHRLRRVMPSAPAVVHTRHWAGIALSFFTIDGLRMVIENCDTLVIGKLLDPHSVAIYFAAVRTASLIAFIYFAVVALAAPKFSTIHISGSREEMQRFVSGVIQLMFWPSLIASVGLMLLGPFALSLFGADFADGYPSLLIALLGFVIRASTGPVEYLLNMTGHHKDTLRVYTISAITSVALNVMLIPHLGIIGAAISSYTVLAGANIWLSLLVRKRLDVTAFVLPLPLHRTRVPASAA